MEAIKISNLSFKYPTKESLALNDINVKVNKGDFVVVCGQSGCGKTTLMRHLKPSITPYGMLKGELLINGEDINTLSVEKETSLIGFIHQNPDNQIVTDMVWHELAFGLESMGLPTEVIRRRVAEMSNYFGIQGWFRKEISTLSGGQKQILNLASVMVMQPEILVLDEPTAQLDPIAADEFMQTVKKLNLDLGVTVIMSEHRLEEAFTLADKVLVLDAGKVISFADPKNTCVNLSRGWGAGKRHPMYSGLPSIMRIFLPLVDNASKIPLTIREGRTILNNLVNEDMDLSLISKTENKYLQHNDKQRLKEAQSTGSVSKQHGVESLKAKNLWFCYDKDETMILRGTDLKACKGEILALMGGNGSGKSTLLKVLMNLLPALRGKVTYRYNGKKINKAEEARKFVALLPQNPQAIFTEITVEDELYEGMSTLDIDDDEKISMVEKMLDLMELSHLRQSNPYDLSGGEQQRLAFGKILLLKPEIIFLDEPTKGLDPFFKEKLGRIITRLAEDGKTLIMVSHDIEFCAKFAHSCGMFFDGRIISVGSADEFFEGNSFYTTGVNKIRRGIIGKNSDDDFMHQFLEELLNEENKK